MNNFFTIVSILLIFPCMVALSEESKKAQKLSLLTLNLHTYQEFSTQGKTESELNEDDVRQRVKNHAPLFDEIARAINELKTDIICLQEVGEWRGYSDSQFGKHPSNAAQQILSRLTDKNYQVTMDWSHYGWDVWKEGTAILSKYPILESESRYISDTNNGTKNFWQSRNVTRIKIAYSKRKYLHVFSVHAGWWESEKEPFLPQFIRLMYWVNEVVDESSDPVLLCGDFNQPAGDNGYNLITQNYNFRDLYLEANPKGMHDHTIDNEIDGWKGIKKSKRIDYLFLNGSNHLKSNHLKVEKSYRIFTEETFGKVSDHFGLFARLKY